MTVPNVPQDGILDPYKGGEIESCNFTVLQSRGILVITYRRPLDLADRIICLPILPLQGVLAELTWQHVRRQLHMPPQAVLLRWEP